VTKNLRIEFDAGYFGRGIIPALADQGVIAR